MSKLNLDVLYSIEFHEKIEGANHREFNDKITIWADNDALGGGKGAKEHIAILIDRWEGKISINGDPIDPDQTMSATLTIPEVIILKKYLETFLELCSL